MEVARVVEVRPEAHAVDIVIMADGRRIPAVRVLSGAAGGDFGMSGFGVPTETGFDARNTRKRDVYCIVTWVRGEPIVLGFLHPQATQMLFEEKERMVYRHPSDVYTTIDGDGNLEIFHPGGAFIRIATNPAHDDLGGRDFNQKWALERNTEKQVHIHVEQAGGVASIDIAPNGDTVVTAPYIKMDAPKVVITGRLTVGETIYAGGTIGSEGDVVSSAGAKSLNAHVHPGVQAGASSTSAPTGGGTMPPQDS